MVALGLALGPVAHASAPIALPVTNETSGPVTLYSQTYNFNQGDEAYFVSNPIAFQTGSWGSGQPTNVGTTTRIVCDDANSVEDFNVHYGQNITPANPRDFPLVRGVFVVPATGTYTCSLTGWAYSTQAAPGMAIRGLGTPGFTMSLVPGATTWTDIDNAVIPTYQTRDAMVDTITNVANTDVTAIMDAQLTTCNDTTSYGGICKGETGQSISTIKTWIVVQPLTSNNVACGGAYTSTPLQIAITWAMHHETFNNQLAAFIPAACPNAQIILKEQSINGNWVVANGGYNYAHAMLLQ